MILRLRPAHGVALLFLANGLVGPSLWPRLPEIRDGVGATDATLGLVLVGVGVGGVLGSVLAPRLSRHLGVDRAATVSAAVLAAIAIGVGVAPTVVVLFLVFAGMGLADGVADITQNALMFDVQRVGDRSLASRMHAVWSAGALAGTGLGTLAATARVSVLTQTVVLAVVAVVLILVARTPVLRLRPVTGGAHRTIDAETVPIAADGLTQPGAAAPPAAVGEPRDRGGSARPRRFGPWVMVITAGVVVAAVESISNEWSALTLRDGLGASVALAGLGPTSFAGAMLVGRLFGDRGIDRFGARRMARFGAGAVVFGGGLGLGVASWLGVPAVLVAGLVVAGVGTATLFPLMLAAGDALDPSGRGVAAASLGARAGFLALPVTVGLVSDTAGPVVAFALLPAAGLIAAVVLPAALARGDAA